MSEAQEVTDRYAEYSAYFRSTFGTDEQATWLLMAALHVVPDLQAVFTTHVSRVVVEVSPSPDENGWVKVLVRYQAKTPTPFGFLGKGRAIGSLLIAKMPRKKGETGHTLRFRRMGIIAVEENALSYQDRLQATIGPFK